jgi:hypothetical protein
MAQVEFFNSMEEALERLEQARKAADARVRRWQARAKPGDCFVTVAEDDLVIYGEVLECYDEDRLRHYRFCRCFSVACPEGEIGDVHVSTIVRFINREEFEQARQKGWQNEPTGGNPGPAPSVGRRRSGNPAGGARNGALRLHSQDGDLRSGFRAHCPVTCPPLAESRWDAPSGRSSSSALFHGARA